MTDPVAFGFDPVECIVHLTESGGFNQPLLTPDGTDWPDAAQICLVIDTDPVTTWTATLDGPTATLAADAVDTTAEKVPGGTRVKVTYSDGSSDPIIWFLGSVVRHGY